MDQWIKADKRIGVNIKKFREKRNLTQEALAAKLQTMSCDMSRGTYAKIEAGLRHVSVDELNSIKEALGMTYEDFFREEE